MRRGIFDALAGGGGRATRIAHPRVPAQVTVLFTGGRESLSTLVRWASCQSTGLALALRGILAEPAGGRIGSGWQLTLHVGPSLSGSLGIGHTMIDNPEQVERLALQAEGIVADCRDAHS